MSATTSRRTAYGLLSAGVLAGGLAMSALAPIAAAEPIPPAPAPTRPPRGHATDGTSPARGAAPPPIQNPSRGGHRRSAPRGKTSARCGPNAVPRVGPATNTTTTGMNRGPATGSPAQNPRVSRTAPRSGTEMSVHRPHGAVQSDTTTPGTTTASGT